jgi:hypothetical protein
LESVGLASASTIAQVLVKEGDDHARRVSLERREIERLTELDLPVLRLPYISGGIDLSSLYELAETVTKQGVR